MNEHFIFRPLPKGRCKPQFEEDDLFTGRQLRSTLYSDYNNTNNRNYKTVNAREWYWHESRCGYFDKLKQIDFEMPRYDSVLTVLWED